MSTIVSSFVKDRASAAQLPTASLISGATKVWLFYNYQSGAEWTFNVASIVDGGLGLTSITLTTPFAAAIPVPVTACQDNVTASSGPYTAGWSDRSASSLAITTRGGSSMLDNGASAIMMGSLA